MRVWRAYKIGTGKTLRYTAADSLPMLSAVRLQMTRGQQHQALGARGTWAALVKDTITIENQENPPPQAWTNSFVPDEHDDFEEETDCPSRSEVPQAVCDVVDDIETIEGKYRKRLFLCDVEGCTKVYQSFRNLFRHQTIGRHVKRVERQNLHDFSIDNYIREIERNHFFSGAPTVLSALRAERDQESVEDSEYPLGMGWALKD